MDLIELLNDVTVMCRDDGNVFIDTHRLDVIDEKLRNSEYIVEKGNLFRMYSKKPISEIKDRILVVSSHVDCEEGITKCFSKNVTPEMLEGTYDNSITNTAILSLMLENKLDDHVVVAFTGDEEEHSHGAREVVKYLRKLKKTFAVVVLDVTNEGWYKEADFTIENDFWKTDNRVSDTNPMWMLKFGKQVIWEAKKSEYHWLYVPAYPDQISDCIPKKNIVPDEAEQDESWEYDEYNVKCFSFCLPSYGDMHSNDGIIIRKDSFIHYVEILEKICNSLCRDI